MGVEASWSPGRVGTAEEFVAELRRLRAVAGQPSFRELSRIAEKRMASASAGERVEPLPPSTTSEILAGKRLPRLPRLEFVESYVAACLTAGQAQEPDTETAVVRWRELWRRLAEPASTVVDTAPPAPPVPAAGRRGFAWPVVLAVFVAGVVLGAAGMRLWGGDGATADAAPDLGADVCIPADEANPAGRDVLSDPWRTNNTAGVVFDPARAADHESFGADVRGGSTEPSHSIILRTADLVEGRKYALVFSATAQPEAQIRVRVQDSGPDYEDSYTRDITVSSSACTRLYRFTAKRTSNHSELTFQAGGNVADVRLLVSGVRLVDQS